MNALDLIRRFEGYRDKPYWDVNAYRAGYGSDTVTMPDGSVVPVRQGMTVDRSMADADLSRRVQSEFAPLAMNAIGGSAWQSLGEPQRAALTSIAYNYGRLPDSVASAIRSGDMAAASQAIRALGSHNDGVNAGRRNTEASIFAGGQVPSGPPGAPQNALAAQQGAAPQPGAFMPQTQNLDPSAFMRPRNALAMQPLVYQRRNYLGSA